MGRHKRKRAVHQLTDKQKNFIKRFLKYLNGTQAVVEAYPNVKKRNTAGVMAYELHRKPWIKKIVEKQLDRDNCGCDFMDFEIK